MLSKWHVTEIESGEVFKRLEKYIIQNAENQGQFLKSYHSKCRESRTVSKITSQ